MCQNRYRLLEAEKNHGDLTRSYEALSLVAASDKLEKERLQATDVCLIGIRSCNHHSFSMTL